MSVTIRHERLIRGEPSERTEMSVEEATRREVNRWMTVVEVDGEEEGDAEGQARD